MDNVKWIPIITATNAAFGMALIRTIIEEGTYNETALSFPSQKAALEGGYAAFSNASYLIIEDESHKNYRKLLRAEDIGMDAPAPADGTTRMRSISWSSTKPPANRPCTPTARRQPSTSRAT